MSDQELANRAQAVNRTLELAMAASRTRDMAELIEWRVRAENVEGALRALFGSLKSTGRP